VNSDPTQGRGALRAVATALAVVLAIGLSACGGSSSSSSAASSSAPTGGASSSGAAVTGSSSSSAMGGTLAAQVRAAAAAIAPFERTPSSIGQTQPLTRRPAGKLVDFIADGTPIGMQILAGVQQATKALGIRLHVINQQGDTPQAIQVAWNQVLASPPAAVINAGDPSILYHRQLAALRARHVVAVTMFTDDDPLFSADIYGPPQYHELGTLEADYMIAKSDGHAHVLIVAVPQIQGLQGVASAIQQTIHSGCSGCTVSTIDTQLSDIGRNDPARVVSYLQQNPSINWIAFIDGDTEIGVPEALRAAGIHGIQMLTGAGGSVNYAYIKSGESTVDASQAPSFSGWALVDATARALDGQPVHVSFLPMQFITRQNLTFNIKQGWPDVPNFRQRFLALWGVKG